MVVLGWQNWQEHPIGEHIGTQRGIREEVQRVEDHLVGKYILDVTIGLKNVVKILNLITTFVEV